MLELLKAGADLVHLTPGIVMGDAAVSYARWCQAGPDRCCVLIGVGKYEKDAVDLASLFSASRSEVVLITGDKATKAGVYSALESLRHRIKATASLIFYFSGHGRLCDNDKLSLELHGGGKLKATELDDSLQAIPCDGLWVILDCCHAAAAASLETPRIRHLECSSGQGQERSVRALSQLRAWDERKMGGIPVRKPKHGVSIGFREDRTYHVEWYAAQGHERAQGIHPDASGNSFTLY